jgi:hypothetical protein
MMALLFREFAYPIRKGQCLAKVRKLERSLEPLDTVLLYDLPARPCRN